MSASNRREFLQQSTAGAAAISTVAWAGFAAAESTEKLAVAVIGPGGMGLGHLKKLVENPRVEVTHVCEVDSKRMAGAVKVVQDKYGKPPEAVTDMRKVFDDKRVAAVWIATPDHWHAPATILACAAGKHVYVEKPCSHNLREGRLMVEAARKHNRVVQQGTQSRSTPHVIAAMNALQSGKIGKILVSKAWNSQIRGNIGHSKPGVPVPEGLDYDMWLGPTPETPYRKNLLPGRWRWWYAFGTGDMGNDGVHDLDIARWGLGVTTHPSTITASGGKFFFDDDQQFPDTQYVVFDYPGDGRFGERRQLVYEQRIWSPYVQEGHENGNAYYGTEGMMIFGKKLGYKLYGRRNKLLEEVPAQDVDLVAHHNNFLDCIQSGAKPNADIEIGYLSTSLCHLGNIATRVGRVIRFDPQSEQIKEDAEANELLHRQYRTGHWAVPSGV